MIPRAVRRRVRAATLTAVASVLWLNRNDVRRWAEFARRAARQRGVVPVSDLLTEARVRLAVTLDPVLRRDPALQDLAVREGVVTLLTTTPAWPDGGAHIKRLKELKGIADVTALQVVER